MNNVSRIKIVLGYTLLLGALLYTLFFVRREMDVLLQTAEADVQWTDSLFALLEEKDRNTRKLLYTLSQTNDSMISASDIERVIAIEDSIFTRQRVQRRIIVHKDTVVTPPKKKTFFRRLAEAFVPSKRDSAVSVKTTREVAMDTVLEAYNPADSLQRILRAVAKERRSESVAAQRRKNALQRRNRQITARIDSLLHGYETETRLRVEAEESRRQAVQQRSANIIGGIAAGAVVLAAFFLVLIGRDVTRSNRYRRQLEEARQRAEELLATREKLMLAITHDFKAPLGSIMGYADLLARLSSDERQRFYISNMKTSSEHLLKLVTDLLDFHRLDLHKTEVHRVSFRPAQLLEEISVSFEPLTAAKGLELRCQIAPELEGTFASDPLRLRQIINNLLSNAVKFTSQGHITLKAHTEPGPPDGSPSNRLVVSVADTGPGMDETDRERIFHEFTRLPGAQGKEGFGLGLSIVRMLVQLLEGDIRVDSTPGQGSTFTVRVPLPSVPFPQQQPASENPDSSTGAPPKAMPPTSTLSKVLLIDDDRIQLTLTAAMLRQNGIDSVCCLQVDELLEALRTDTFDLLLTDVQMPSMNGFDLLSLLRASNIPQARTIPIIAVTARSDMQDGDLTTHGFAGCLRKPFTAAELLALVDNAVPQTRQPADTPPPDSRDDEDAPCLEALAAFAGSDADEASSILHSFADETAQSIGRLRQAIADANTAALAATAHKMIPLFTLLRLTALVALLRQLEAARDLPFSPRLASLADEAARRAEQVLQQTRLRLQADTGGKAGAAE